MTNSAKLEGMPFYTLDSPLSVDTTITQTIVESVLLWHEGGVVGVGEKSDFDFLKIDVSAIPR